MRADMQTRTTVFHTSGGLIVLPSGPWAVMFPLRGLSEGCSSAALGRRHPFELVEPSYLSDALLNKMDPKRPADASPRLGMEFGFTSNRGRTKIEGRGATALHQKFPSLKFAQITASHPASSSKKNA